MVMGVFRDVLDGQFDAMAGWIAEMEEAINGTIPAPAETATPITAARSTARKRAATR